MDMEAENSAVAKARRDQGRSSANRPRPGSASLRPLAQLEHEASHLERFLNERVWDERRGFYHDLRRDGERGDVMTIGAYWALLAGVAPAERLDRFVAALEDTRKFNRPCRVPSLPADDPGYAPLGGYWCGSVWPMTNYMVLRGLTAVGCDRPAHDIGLNYVLNITRVFEQTGTLWENCAPENATPGKPSLPDFVGPCGIGPVAALLEYVMGLRPDATRGRLVWDVRLLEEHGVRQYPFAAEGLLNLRCRRRNQTSDAPVIEAQASVPLELEVRWPGGQRVVPIMGL